MEREPIPSDMHPKINIPTCGQHKAVNRVESEESAADVDHAPIFEFAVLFVECNALLPGVELR